MALGWVWWGAWSLLVAQPFVWQVALGDINLPFTWQAWRLLTSTLLLRGKRGTYGTGLALARADFCVASVALGDIDLWFAWPAWHLVTPTLLLHGKHGTYGTGLVRVAQVVRGLYGWQWQAGEVVTSAFILRGKRLVAIGRF